MFFILTQETVTSAAKKSEKNLKFKKNAAENYRVQIVKAI